MQDETQRSLESEESVLQCSLPVRKAARQVLKPLLHDLERAVARVADADEPTPQRIHDVRVATRRTEAAVRSFRDAIRRKDRRRIMRRLRSLRRGAAPARGRDVHLKLLREAAPDLPRPAIPSLIDQLGRVENQWRVGLRALSEAVGECPPSKVRTLRRRMIKGLRDVERRGTPSSKCGADAEPIDCRPGGESRGMTFAMAGRAAIAEHLKAIRDVEDTADLSGEWLHALRVRVKRVRYIIEIFEPCMVGGGRQLLERLRSLQTRLGEINDLADLGALLSEDCPCEAGNADHVAAPAAGGNEGEPRHDEAGADGLGLPAPAELARHFRLREERLQEAFLTDWQRGDWCDVFARLATCIPERDESPAPPALMGTRVAADEPA